MPDGDKDVRQQGLLLISVGIHNGTDTLGDSLIISYTNKYTPTRWSSNHAPWYLSKEVENLCPYKSLYTNAYL